MSHLSETGSRKELGKVGQVLDYRQQRRFDLSGFNLIYRPGNSAELNDLELKREYKSFVCVSGLHFTLPKKLHFITF